MNNIYFDNAATTKLDEEVLKEMMPYLTENYGNASSIYRLGRESRKAVEDSREKIAKVLNCKASEVYFTAGGSESDNTAIKGIARANKSKGGSRRRNCSSQEKKHHWKCRCWFCCRGWCWCGSWSGCRRKS